MQPFWPVWLESRGLTAVQVGLTLAAAQWLRVGAGPLVAAATDRLGRRRRMMLALALLALALYAACAGAAGFWPLLLASAGAAAAMGALLPIGETVTLAAVYRHRLDYGRIRLWGSLTFIAASALAGLAVREGGVNVVLAMVLATVAATVLVCLMLPRPPARPREAVTWRGLGGLLTDRRLLGFALAAAAIQASHAMIYGFGSLHWRAQGIGDGVIGLLWAAGVVAETLLFAVSGRAVERLGVTSLLRLGAVAAVVRWLLMALDPGPAGLFPLMALHAATFGATYLATMHVITRLAPPHLAATAQALYAAGSGVLMGLAAGASGMLYDRSAAGGFLAMAALAALALLLALRLREPAAGTR